MLIHSDGDIPGATESLGKDGKVSCAKLHALWATLRVDFHLPFEEVARLLGIILERELSWRTPPPEQQQIKASRRINKGNTVRDRDKRGSHGLLGP